MFIEVMTSYLVSIVVSVIAGIILHYIYKWLDRDDQNL